MYVINGYSIWIFNVSFVPFTTTSYQEIIILCVHEWSIKTYLIKPYNNNGEIKCEGTTSLLTISMLQSRADKAMCPTRTMQWFLKLNLKIKIFLKFPHLKNSFFTKFCSYVLCALNHQNHQWTKIVSIMLYTLFCVAITKGNNV